MRIARLVVSCLLPASVACSGPAEDGGTRASTDAVRDGTRTYEHPEVGYVEVRTTADVPFDASQGGFRACTGTLIAPSTVLTSKVCTAMKTDADEPGADYGRFILRPHQVPIVYTIDNFVAVPNESVVLLHLSQPASVDPAILATTDWQPNESRQLDVFGYGGNDPSCARPARPVKRHRAITCTAFTSDTPEVFPSCGNFLMCPQDEGAPVFEGRKLSWVFLAKVGQSDDWDLLNRFTADNIKQAAQGWGDTVTTEADSN